MTSPLERKANRYIKVVNKVSPRLLKHTEAIVLRGDAMTHIHNRDFDLSDAEKRTLGKDLERTWAAVHFAGSVALHAPSLLVGYERLCLASGSFERELAKTMPDASERVDWGEIDFYSLAAELVGVDGESLMNHALTRAGVSIED